MRLSEKWRPDKLDDVAGQPKAVDAVRGLLARGGAGGRAWWISGPTGTGKTTLGRIIARTLADPSAIVELCARELTADLLRELADSWAYYGFGKGGRALIVNEAHGLRADLIERFLQLTETLPGHVCVVFTTTKQGEERLFEDQIDAAPLLHRCECIPLTGQGFARPAAERCRFVAQAEGLDGQPLEAYVKLLQRPEVKNSLRAALDLIEKGAMRVGGGE